MSKGAKVVDRMGNRGVVISDELDGCVFVAFAGQGTRRCVCSDLRTAEN